MLRRFERNTVGNDYVVGDIHGSYHHLARALREIGFDEAKDRLFSVGDLVDRGRYNDHVEHWLDKPWFHAVRGNHEQMAIDYTNDTSLAYMYAMNGGGWFVALPVEDQLRIARRFLELPYAFEVDTERGRIGIVHAEVPYGKWPDYEGWCALGERGIEQVLWARDKIANKDERVIEAIDHVYVGHTPKRRVVRLGNVSYIDTGAVWGRNLTLVNLATGEEHRIGCYANQ